MATRIRKGETFLKDEKTVGEPVASPRDRGWIHSIVWHTAAVSYVIGSIVGKTRQAGAKGQAMAVRETAVPRTDLFAKWTLN